MDVMKSEKVGNQEGPRTTTTAAEFMKEWGSFGTNELSG